MILAYVNFMQNIYNILDYILNYNMHFKEEYLVYDLVNKYNYLCIKSLNVKYNLH